MSHEVTMRRTASVVAVGGILVGAAVFVWQKAKPKTDSVVVQAAESDARISTTSETKREPSLPAIAGLDLTKIAVKIDGATAPAAEGRTVRLTVDPELQRTAVELMAAHHLPEASIVMIDPATGRVLVYASHLERGAERDLCAEATAPSASVFKVVTGSALVEDAHATADTRECFNGQGSERIEARDLVDDPKKDKYCTTLAGAMGRSLNVVFAKLAQKDLQPAQVEAMARRYGYGDAVPFDVPVQPSGVTIPGEPLEFARTSAGFWNTTLSPLEAAWMSATIARGGEAVRPLIVDDVRDPSGEVVYTSPPAPVLRRVVKPETAQAVTAMMESTVNEGTSFRAFHDAHGRAFIPNVPVAGKTGTLTDAQQSRYYSWFTGFAPSRPSVDAKSVAIAVLIVNDPNWSVKANVVARDMLRAYFAAQNIPNVTRPSPNAIARHHSVVKKAK